MVNKYLMHDLEELGIWNTTMENWIKLNNGSIQAIEGIPQHIKDKYKTVWEISQKSIIDLSADRQPFVDQSQSLNLFIENLSFSTFNSMHMYGWKKGLKAVALYRDNCKASQPLSAKGKTTPTETVAVAKVADVAIPKTRHGVTHSFVVGNHKVYLTANHYDDGRLGEIFLKSAREGSMVSGLLDTLARLMSKALQRGESVESLIDSLLNMRFEPWGATDDMDIPFAKSIPDYIARWLGRHFLPLNKQVMLGIIGEDVAKSLEDSTPTNVDADELVTGDTPTQEVPEPVVMSAQATLDMPMKKNGDVVESTAPPCPTCGALMVRNGTCYACRECGTTTGCS